jgi:hypothetical protein
MGQLVVRRIATRTATCRHMHECACASSFFLLSNVIDHTLAHFLEKDRALHRSELERGAAKHHWYWTDFAEPHFNTKDPALKAELTKNLFETEMDFASATFITDYVATPDSLRKKFMEYSGQLRAIKFNFCKSGQGDDGTNVVTGDEYMYDHSKDIRSSNIKDFFPHNKSNSEMTKEGLGLYYMLRMLHERGAADTAFGELPADATSSSEGDPQLYSRGAQRATPKAPQVDLATALKAPINIARSRHEEEFFAAKASKTKAELAALGEKQIDEDMEKLMTLNGKLSEINKITHTGTYRMIMSRREISARDAKEQAPCGPSRRLPRKDAGGGPAR